MTTQNPYQKQNQMGGKFGSETNAQQVRKQNQQSAQQSQGQNPMYEEFGSETDVNQVKKQIQQAEANKQNASGQRANQFQNGSR